MSTQRLGKHKNKSLCEKSMILVSNIIKLSSLSFVGMSFGTTSSARAPAAEKNGVAVVPVSSLKVVADDHHDFNSQRSKEPKGGSKRRRSYLMEPPQEDSPSSHVTAHRPIKKDNIDDMAADFIEKKRENIKKNGTDQSHSSSASKVQFSRKLLIPAPKAVKELKFSS